MPTHWGVALTIPMWLELKKVGPELKESDPVLKTAAACYGLFHDNQLGYYECSECFPFPAQSKAEQALSTASTLEIAPMEVAATVVETTAESGSVMAKKRPAAKKLKLNICENTCTF